MSPVEKKVMEMVLGMLMDASLKHGKAIDSMNQLELVLNTIFNPEDRMEEIKKLLASTCQILAEQAAVLQLASEWTDAMRKG